MRDASSIRNSARYAVAAVVATIVLASSIVGAGHLQNRRQETEPYTAIDGLDFYCGHPNEGGPTDIPAVPPLYDGDPACFNVTEQDTHVHIDLDDTTGLRVAGHYEFFGDGEWNDDPFCGSTLVEIPDGAFSLQVFAFDTQESVGNCPQVWGTRGTVTATFYKETAQG